MLNICIQNLGMYNEGVLNFKWVELPISKEDFADALKEIGIGSKDCFGIPYEEWHMPDWECDIPFLEYSEYPDIDYLNEVAEWFDTADDDDIVKVEYLFWNECDMTFREALDEIDNINYFGNIKDNDSLGRFMAESLGIFYGINERSDLYRYFDFDAYGKSFTEDGTCVFFNDGCIEDYRR